MQDINLFVAELSYLRPLCIIIISLLVSNNSTMTEEEDGCASSYCSECKLEWLRAVLLPKRRADLKSRNDWIV